MKIEVITLTPEEQRVLLLFDPTGPTPQDQQVDAYLQKHQLEPKRHYHETREGKDYLVYYFGFCYLDGHREQLAGLATEANLEALKPF